MVSILLEVWRSLTDPDRLIHLLSTVVTGAFGYALLAGIVFAETGLLGGAQTTAWLYMLWHGGFPLAVIGYALRPTAGAAATLAVCAVLKPTLDAVAFSRLRRELFSWRAFGVVWVKDILLFLTWVHGLFARTVVWRGNRLRVHSGSRLVPLAEPTPSEDPAVTGFSETLLPLHGTAAAVMSDLRA